MKAEIEARELTAEMLRELISYESDTGVFTWLKTQLRSRPKPGDVAGSLQSSKRYFGICIYGRIYLAHRLAWLYVHGRWPTEQIDHIDGNPLNNRLANLRECTADENQQNRKVGKRNKTGLLGVYHEPKTGKWCASIRCRGVMRHLGTFATKEGAGAAYLAAKRELHTFNPVPRITK